MSVKIKIKKALLEGETPQLPAQLGAQATEEKKPEATAAQPATAAKPAAPANAELQSLPAATVEKTPAASAPQEKPASEVAKPVENAAQLPAAPLQLSDAALSTTKQEAPQELPNAEAATPQESAEKKLDAAPTAPEVKPAVDVTEVNKQTGINKILLGVGSLLDLLTRQDAGGVYLQSLAETCTSEEAKKAIADFSQSKIEKDQNGFPTLESMQTFINGFAGFVNGCVTEIKQLQAQAAKLPAEQPQGELPQGELPAAENAQ